MNAVLFKRSLFLFLMLMLLNRFTLAQELTTSPAPDKLPKVKHLIDTHIHLYDTTRENGVPWPPKEDRVLYKPHLPEEFTKVSKKAGVTGVVIVEASDRIDDNTWVLDLVKDDDFYIGLVGNIDPYREDFDSQLKNLAKDKRLVGLRARVKGKPIDYSNERVLQSFKQLSERGLTLDILMNGEGPQTIKQVAEVAEKLPKLQIVVNHVLGYNIDGKLPGQPWIDAVKELAKHENVSVKVSGLYQRCVPQPAVRDLEHYRELLDILWDSFGENRLIYGSNWPCTKKSGDYVSFVVLVNRYFSEKGNEASEKYFWKNASRVYRLGLK